MSKKFPLHKDDKNVSPKPNFPKIEEDILNYWEENDIQNEALNLNKGNNTEFVFYDGPPFANGLPHYGHLLTGFVKDLIPRYKTMKGCFVPRKFGWDCHGMPAEYEAEKILNIKDKKDIEKIGLKKFNDVCRQSVLKYTSEWKDYVKRQARWVDFEGGYKTLDKTFMESVIWAFKELWKKELICKGFRVLWYCVRCETPLSATETKMDEAYRTRQDAAVTVPFELENGLTALAWTTTPWTLPSNLALAVNNKIKYAVVELNGKKYIVSESRLSAYKKEFGENPTIIKTVQGTELVGLKYKPLFDYFIEKTKKGGELENAYKVISADYVTEEDGTGIVHTAPGFGEDDSAAGKENNIGIVVPVDDSGKFTEEIADNELKGMSVLDSNRTIINILKQKDQLFQEKTYEHNYPHCWRCSTPLIQKAVSSWFVDVPKIVKQMVETNKNICWVPKHIKEGQFGHWIANAKEWSISRSRYWGSPIPVWESDNPKYPRCDVYGSIEELEKDFNVKVDDLHRPYIDDLVRKNPDDPTGKSLMKRVPEVLDCWFESGSMPYASVHFPFENNEWFSTHFPADFIVEYIGQTRGWFYTLHVLSNSLFNKEAFSTCLSHGIVLGDDGQKMSKTLKNYPDVNEVYDRDGADAMRWFLMSSSILKGENLKVTNDGIRDSVRKNLLPLWNAYSFFALYYNSAKTEIKLNSDGIFKSENILDNYIFAKLNDLVKVLTDNLDEFKIAESYEKVSDFIDILNNWYIRGSRQRFWDEEPDAFNTLYNVLIILSKLIAPLAPFLADEIFRGLTNKRSVHLEKWEEFNNDFSNADLVNTMDRVREICSISLGIRKKNKIRVRQVLSNLKIVDSNIDNVKKFSDLIQNEINVKNVEFSSLENDTSENISVKIELNPKILGPKIGPLVQDAIKAAKSGNWVELENGKVQLELPSQKLEIEANEYEKVISVKDGLDAGILSKGGYVILDTVLTTELKNEGYIRDIIRKIQGTRKEKDLNVSDRINLFISVEKEKVPLVKEFADVIKKDVLAVELQVDGATSADEIIKIEKVNSAEK